MGEAARKLDPSNLNKKAYSKINITHPLGEIFQSDSYAIVQPLFQWKNESYQITNKNRTEMYSAKRPINPLRTFFALCLAFFAASVCYAGLEITTALIFPKVDKIVSIAMNYSALFIAWIGGMAVYKKTMPLRITRLVQGAKEKGRLVFEIRPSSSFFIFNHEYVLKDSQGKKIMLFKKRFFDSLFRKKWHAYTMSGRYIFSAVEDNILLAIMRRYLRLGSFIPLQFNLNKGGGKAFGTFKRKYSLKDKYRLSYDQKAAPGWIILAMALLLDTGERR